MEVVPHTSSLTGRNPLYLAATGVAAPGYAVPGSGPAA